MNILFVHYKAINPLKGGTGRVTSILAENFLKNGDSVFVAFQGEDNHIMDFFTDKLSWDYGIESMCDFIVHNKIDIIISQEGWKEPLLRKAIQKSCCNCYLIACLHCAPDAFCTSFKDTVKNFWDFPIKRNLMKSLTFPVYKYRLYHLYTKKIKEANEVCDVQVLLSDRFKEDFIKIYRPRSVNNICSIHNPLSYSVYAKPEDISKKEKIVLVVSRLEESSKRLSLVFNIWERIEKMGIKDWKLIIVGGGVDEKYYKRLVRRLGLENIVFIGYSDPREYYQRASIFLMTSFREGWGLTLTESMQFGVIPIAMSSFKAIYDIIDDGVNGFLAPWKDINYFAKILVAIMGDRCRREEMALKAIEKSKTFSADKIIDKWNVIFRQLLKQ